MTNFEAITKSLIWRFFIAIPLSMTVAYYYTDSISVALELTIVANILSTIMYYLFDMFWFSKVNKHFKQTCSVLQEETQIAPEE